MRVKLYEENKELAGVDFLSPGFILYAMKKVIVLRFRRGIKSSFGIEQKSIN